MRRLVVVALMVMAAVGACSDDGSDRLVLDGRPRVPDDEGVVTAVSRQRLTIDGKRTYTVTRDIQVFSTYTLEAVPLLGRQGQYVHVGVDGKRLRWLAAIGAVITTGEPTVYYTGVLKSVNGRRATFRDGTVFRLGGGVDRPNLGQAQVEVDPAAHVVRRIVSVGS